MKRPIIIEIKKLPVETSYFDFFIKYIDFCHKIFYIKNLFSMIIFILYFILKFLVFILIFFLVVWQLIILCFIILNHFFLINPALFFDETYQKYLNFLKINLKYLFILKVSKIKQKKKKHKFVIFLNVLNWFLLITPFYWLFWGIWRSYGFLWINLIYLLKILRKDIFIFGSLLIFIQFLNRFITLKPDKLDFMFFYRLFFKIIYFFRYRLWFFFFDFYYDSYKPFKRRLKWFYRKRKRLLKFWRFKKRFFFEEIFSFRCNIYTKFNIFVQYWYMFYNIKLYFNLFKYNLLEIYFVCIDYIYYIYYNRFNIKSIIYFIISFIILLILYYIFFLLYIYI